MELHNIKIADLQGLERGRLREIEVEIRREMVTARMDVYAAEGQYSSKKRGMKKSLARLLTVKNEHSRNATSKKVK
jgi:ribosomal protein L29